MGKLKNYLFRDLEMSDSFMADVTSYDYEPDDPNWVDHSGIRHIFVHDLGGWVEWRFQNGEMVKVFDLDESPF